MNLETEILGVLLVGGFLGSLRHCLGMCGPMVTMCGAQPRFNGSVMASNQILYHGSRIATYAVLGAILGGVGSLLGLGRGLSGLTSAVSIALGVGVLILGLGYVGWLSGRGLEGTRAWWTRAVLKALGRTGPSRIMLLGMLNGLMPCSLVYGALLLAALIGRPLQGALGMTLFGVGTVPALLLAALTAREPSVRAREVLSRTGGILMIVVGLQLAIRGLSALGLAG